MTANPSSSFAIGKIPLNTKILPPGITNLSNLFPGGQLGVFPYSSQENSQKEKTHAFCVLSSLTTNTSQPLPSPSPSPSSPAFNPLLSTNLSTTLLTYLESG